MARSSRKAQTSPPRKLSTSQPRWGDPLGKVSVGNVTDSDNKAHAGEQSRVGKAMPAWTRENNIPEPMTMDRKDWVDRARRWKGAGRHDD